MRLAYFTPLPPSKSGIADYNAELLPYLAPAADITVFVEKQDEVKANQTQPYAVAHHESFDARHAERPYDLVIYHQGNNPYHEYVYEHAIRTPGMLVLHEHCLHHLLAWKMLRRQQEAAYADELFYAYGAKGELLARARVDATSSEYQQFVLPLNRKLINRQRGLVVHNQYAASQLELDDDTLPLEQLVTRYAEGSKLVKLCEERLASVEKKIEIITRNAVGEPRLEEFEPAAASEPEGKAKAKREDVSLF